jgi:hypothetical protein
MNPTLYEAGVAIALVITASALVAWFLYYKASGTRRRMQGMMMRVGIDPEFVSEDDKKTVIKGIRRRCRKCQTEDICERWLANKIQGGNEFCPNAKIFNIISKHNAQAA